MTKCKSCGGPLERVENHYVCEYCGTRWEVNPAEDIYAVERANAWQALRDSDFEKAAATFESILAQKEEDYEGWWGKALAEAHITYVIDLNENKRVPTCNNITEEAFEQSATVKKAMAYAPKDIAAGYEAMAKQIDAIRVDWLEKARKEPAYDVFLSYKDSDKERGLTRTQDSVDAQDLYQALTEEGYRVFYSRVSLRDKVSEQYEPYIYNAIKTAPVMIVFGEKAEYFGSTWIKNEWSRFAARIAKGEKHKNSLVVAFKDMDPGELPAALRSRQCLNMADMTFLSDLTRHIRKVIEASQQNTGLERIVIEQGAMAKKATRLTTNTVQTHALGEAAVETDITTRETLKLVDSYLTAEAWGTAERILDDVLFDNPGDAEAMWRQLLLKMKLKNDAALLANLASMNPELWAYLKKILDSATRDFASAKLSLLFTACQVTTDRAFHDLLEIILLYAYDKRKKDVASALDCCIEKAYYGSFLSLLEALDSEAVDDYIRCNLAYAEKYWKDNNRAGRECVNRILSVDEGNIAALRLQFDLDGAEKAEESVCLEHFETLLRFTDDQMGEITRFLTIAPEVAGRCALAPSILRYYSGELAGLDAKLQAVADAAVQYRLFGQAETLYRLILSDHKKNAKAYWGLCLALSHCVNEKELENADISLNSIPEFTKYMVLVAEKRRQQCIALSERQEKKLAIVRLKQLVSDLQSEISGLNRELSSLDNSIKMGRFSLSADEVEKKKVRETRFAELNEQQKKLESTISQLKQEKTTLGVFKGKEKKVIQEKIDSLQSQLAEIEEERKSLKAENQAAQDRANTEGRTAANTRRAELRKNIESKQSQLQEYMRESKRVFLKKLEKVGIKISGNSVTMGHYKGDPIEWLVLASDGSKKFLLSKNALDAKKYHNKKENTNWSACDLRKWLNSEFLNQSFSPEEREFILTTTVKADKNPEYSTNPGPDTQDKVFLLSVNEVTKFFSSDKDRMCVPTEYAIAQGAYTSSDYTVGGKATCWWWLRSPGYYPNDAALVYGDGSLRYGGNSVHYGNGCIRPALWINLDS